MLDQQDSSDQQKQWEQDRELYQSYRTLLCNCELEAEKSYDTWLLTLAGGALGVSMTFLSDLVKGQPVWSWLLLMAWLLFGLAIGCILVNMRLSPTANEKARQILDDEFSPRRYGRRVDVWDYVRKRQEKCRLPKAIDVLNITSLISFLAGIICLAVFVSRNLG